VSEDIAPLLEKIRLKKHIDFRGYKKSSLKRRIARRRERTKTTSMKEYLSLLNAFPDEYEELIESLLIKETAFFRDHEVFEEIRNTVLPDILEVKKIGEEVRIWCSGCATGEEAYSIAMLLAEDYGPLLAGFTLKLYVTDLSRKALQVARRGGYTHDSLRAVPEELKRKYFFDGRVTEGLRQMIIFGRHDLVSDPPISNIDLLICRHVLIYFTYSLQRKVFDKLFYALRSGGILILGKSETLPKDMERLFKIVSSPLRIYQKL
jgi:two-component system CheB/CheR fusion protein